MFSHDSTARSDRQNRLLAGYLAFVGGFVNSCGIVLIGTFTSHVTGAVGRLARDAVTYDYASALVALSIVFAFFVGAFVVSMILESRALGHASRKYAIALALEALALASFRFLLGAETVAQARVVQIGAMILSMAMGIQNGLVSRLSGAVVRTTHLTGVVTDLGVEAARWSRFFLERRGPHADASERPPLPKTLLLSTIAGSFFAGAVAGAVAAVRLGRDATLLAAGAVVLCAAYAFVRARARGVVTGA